MDRLRPGPKRGYRILNSDGGSIYYEMGKHYSAIHPGKVVESPEGIYFFPTTDPEQLAEYVQQELLSDGGGDYSWWDLNRWIRPYPDLWSILAYNWSDADMSDHEAVARKVKYIRREPELMQKIMSTLWGTVYPEDLGFKLESLNPSEDVRDDLDTYLFSTRIEGYGSDPRDLNKNPMVYLAASKLREELRGRQNLEDILHRLEPYRRRIATALDNRDAHHRRLWELDELED